jgi:acyl carrier protein
MSTTMKQIEGILLTNIASGTGKGSLAADEDLIAQGIIDSLAIMKLVETLERTFGIRIPDEEVVPDNFQDLGSIAQFVDRQRGQA